MLRTFLACLASLLIASAAMAAPRAGTNDPARQFVDHIGGQALNTLKNTGLSKQQKTEHLEALFSTAVDIPYVAKFVLGRYWRTATPQQQKDYLSAYQPFLIKNYVGRVARYEGQTYTLGASRPVEGGAVVGMTLHTPDGSAPDVVVDYRLNKTPQGYKVIDILVEGVSLLNTQRSEFSSVVANKGLPYLIDALRKKTAAGK